MGAIMNTIPLGGRYGLGKVVIVDDEDYAELAQYRWYCSNGYAARMTRRNGKRIMLQMQWLILRPRLGFVIDHINGNRLDNRRSNLRVCRKADNNKNKVGPLKVTSSKYKGGVLATNSQTLESIHQVRGAANSFGLLPG